MTHYKQPNYTFYATKKRFFPFITAFILTLISICPPVGGQTQILNLPKIGTHLGLTETFTPPLIQGLTLNPDDPFKIDFTITHGDIAFEEETFKSTSLAMVKYFLAALTVPDSDQWVNLSPDEPDRIIPKSFATTGMGRDLLAQDYLLKQLSASLMDPQKELGANFWQAVYAKAQKNFWSTNIPIDTFHRIWIIPDQAKLATHQNNVFIMDSHLKIMLEEDFQRHPACKTNCQHQTNNSITAQDTLKPSDQVRTYLLPAIEHEINHGQTFAPLRQIYHAMILATWYKMTLEETILGQDYVDQNKINGIAINDKTVKQKIYDQYLATIKEGVVNLIKEDYDPVTESIIPRKYFAGGFERNALRHLLNIQEISLNTLKNQINIRWKKFKTAKSTPNIAHQVHINLLNNRQDLPKNIVTANSPISNEQLKDMANNLTRDAFAQGLNSSLQEIRYLKEQPLFRPEDHYLYSVLMPSPPNTAQINRQQQQKFYKAEESIQALHDALPKNIAEGLNDPEFISTLKGLTLTAVDIIDDKSPSSLSSFIGIAREAVKDPHELLKERIFKTLLTKGYKLSRINQGNTPINNEITSVDTNVKEMNQLESVLNKINDKVYFERLIQDLLRSMPNDLKEVQEGTTSWEATQDLTPTMIYQLGALDSMVGEFFFQLFTMQNNKIPQTAASALTQTEQNVLNKNPWLQKRWALLGDSQPNYVNALTKLETRFQKPQISQLHTIFNMIKYGAANLSLDDLNLFLSIKNKKKYFKQISYRFNLDMNQSSQHNFQNEIWKTRSLLKKLKIARQLIQGDLVLLHVGKGYRRALVITAMNNKNTIKLLTFDGLNRFETEEKFEPRIITLEAQNFISHKFDIEPEPITPTAKIYIGEKVIYINDDAQEYPATVIGLHEGGKILIASWKAPFFPNWKEHPGRFLGHVRTLNKNNIRKYLKRQTSSNITTNISESPFTPQKQGGINLNREFLDMDIHARQAKSPLTSTSSAINQQPIESLFPVIIDITPISWPIVTGQPEY